MDPNQCAAFVARAIGQEIVLVVPEVSTVDVHATDQPEDKGNNQHQAYGAAKSPTAITVVAVIATSTAE
jgi:hypothetical protein